MGMGHGVFVATLLVSPLYQEDILSGQDRSSHDTCHYPFEGEVDFLRRLPLFVNTPPQNVAPGGR